MNKISIETNIGFGLIFSVSFWAAINGKVPFALLLMPPIAYAIMYLFISIFIWDKRRTVKLTMNTPGFKKGEVLKIGGSGQKVIIVDVKQIDIRTISCTTFPIKTSKYKIVNIARSLYRNVSCYLRNVGR